MNLEKLIQKQIRLDQIILERAGIKDIPVNKVRLALLVELGELANEVQTFKFWKHNKNINQEKIKEEWADCLHFALSLDSILYKSIGYIPEIKQMDQEEIEYLKDNFESTLIIVINSIATGKSKKYSSLIIELGLIIGLTKDEMVQAYDSKYEKNIERQKQGY